MQRSSKTGYLISHNPVNTPSNTFLRVPEEELLRDAVLILQGIDGRHLRFYETKPTLNPRKHGLPIHPLERDESQNNISQKGLIFLEGEDGVG